MLLLHKNYYLEPEVISLLDHEGKITSKNLIPANSHNYENAVEGMQSDIDIQLAEYVFNLDCIDTTQLGSYSNMWHLYALANVLQIQILSIYPENNQRIRPAYNKLIKPRVINDRFSHLTFALMWTRVYSMPIGQVSWSPNHFVPCLRK